MDVLRYGTLAHAGHTGRLAGAKLHETLRAVPMFARAAVSILRSQTGRTLVGAGAAAGFAVAAAGELQRPTVASADAARDKYVIYGIFFIVQ